MSEIICSAKLSREDGLPSLTNKILNGCSEYRYQREFCDNRGHMTIHYEYLFFTYGNRCELNISRVKIPFYTHTHIV